MSGPNYHEKEMSKMTERAFDLATREEPYPEIGVCCLCGGTYTHFGNNPYPLCDEDDDSSRCCDACNWRKVIPARSRQAEQLRKA